MRKLFGQFIFILFSYLAAEEEQTQEGASQDSLYTWDELYSQDENYTRQDPYFEAASLYSQGINSQVEYSQQDDYSQVANSQEEYSQQNDYSQIANSKESGYSQEDYSQNDTFPQDTYAQDANSQEEYSQQNDYSQVANSQDDTYAQEDYSQDDIDSLVTDDTQYDSIGQRTAFSSLANDFHNFPNSRLELGYNAGRFIGIRRNYLEAGVFLPAIYQDYLLTFADARVYRFDTNNIWAVSAGVGTRMELDQGIGGANIFYDYLEGRVSNGFHRVGIGLEWLGHSWDVRTNVYLPVGNRTQSSLHVYADYIGNYLVTCTEQEKCIREGFDAEIGRLLAYWNDVSLYGAIGPYYYHARNDKSYFGGQLRFDLSWRDWVSFRLRTSYDERYRTHVQARVMISIPFDYIWGSEFLDGYYANRLTQPVIRNGIIFTKKRACYTTNY